ncbi:MAG: galactose mutarotase [Lachnospiraceae bacterium]|nr:galactose mutarotase [Lachnospiraceae bacterium]
MIKADFGKAKDGTPVSLYTVTNKNGVVAAFTDFGAILVSLTVPDKNGGMADVVLGYDNVESYYDNGPNFGATIGRHANRIGKATFTLNGKEYKLDLNDGNNNLHGGFNGYHKRVWNATSYVTAAGETMEFTYHSPDGDQGFPGNLDISVKYTLTDDNEIVIAYDATSDADTVINLTNHSYFNLAGHASGDTLKQKVWIDSDEFTFADEESIPNGEIRKTAGTPMDFSVMKPIADGIDADYDQIVWGKGFDHNWILKTVPGRLSLVATMVDEESGRAMDVYTDLPGMQFYSGNFLDGTEIGKGGVPYIQRSGVCFETQYYPNAINVPEFSQPVLKAGETYRTATVYKFYVR